MVNKAFHLIRRDNRQGFDIMARRSVQSGTYVISSRLACGDTHLV